MAEEWLDRIDNIQEDHNAVVVFGDNAKITPLDFNGQAAQGLLGLIQYYNDTLVEYILGASMPSGGGGEAGSLARGGR